MSRRHRRVAVLLLIWFVAVFAYVRYRSHDVPYCKIVDGREIDDHHCIPYCPPDPSECR